MISTKSILSFENSELRSHLAEVGMGWQPFQLFAGCLSDKRLGKLQYEAVHQEYPIFR